MATNTKETAQVTQTTTDTPVSSTHADDATAMIQEIQAMGQRIPEFTLPADDNANRRLVASATVPQAAIDKMTALVQTKPLLTGNDIGPVELRDLVSIAQAYRPVPDEAEAFAGALRHTINGILAKAGSAVLTAYEVAKRQSRRPEGADLRPHVADMKRLLSGRFPSRKKSKQVPAPQPAPQTPTGSSSASTAPPSSQPKVQSEASASGKTDPVVTAPVATKPQ